MNSTLGQGTQGLYTTLGGSFRQPGDESARRFGVMFFRKGKRIIEEKQGGIRYLYDWRINPDPNERRPREFDEILP